jgi:hypothetical protein
MAAGPRGLDALNLEALIDRYGEAWSEPDAARRAALLASVWAPEATYSDPTVAPLDMAGLLAHIARVQAGRPGAIVRRSTVIDAHHEVLRFGFEVIGADGAVLRHGVDFVVLDAARTCIRQVTGFFGALDTATGDAIGAAAPE